MTYDYMTQAEFENGIEDENDKITSKYKKTSSKIEPMKMTLDT